MYQKIFDKIDAKGSIRCITVLSGEKKGAKAVYTDRDWEAVGGKDFDWEPYKETLRKMNDTRMIQIGEQIFFLEVYQRNPRMIICGGGHVSQPLARVAKMLGFYVIVIDDREEFVTKERFPDADERICGSFEDLDNLVEDYPNSYYVTVTRGHSFDTVCARQILRRSYIYFGMIGSRTKVAATVEKLSREGFTKEQIATMHSPIGLNIGGETPEELTISILAEVVQVKNQHYCAYLDLRVMEAVRENRPGVMVTIIEKAGSSPRGIGSKMWVEEDGTLIGTIGGGMIEYRAGQEALMAEHMSIREYDLTNEDSSKLGMICGGRVKVLFERSLS